MKIIAARIAALFLIPLGLLGCDAEKADQKLFDPVAWETNVEEQRLTSAYLALPGIANRWDGAVSDFAGRWAAVKTYDQATSEISATAAWLWRFAKEEMAARSDYDDRPLYWTRLGFSWVIKNVSPSFDVGREQRDQLLELLEEVSRGRQELDYITDAPLRILVTGFDPFLLDRNVAQGNPSGIAALALDGQVVEYQGKRAEVNAVIFPVRYKDFDEGEVERLLRPYYQDGLVDMVVTISQGRSDFDLERYPGRRRSSTAPGNLNVYTGTTSKNPIAGLLNGEEISGPEFVEFSLPVDAMQGALGDYAINDNHRVTTLEDGDIEPMALAELDGRTAVQGSGGGYLSNEISYRSIRLRNQLGSTIPTGHIHTPKPSEFTPEIIKPIIDQIEDMLKRSLTTL